MKKGLIIRHLVLPGHFENSKGVLKSIKEIVGPDAIVSLMSQYCPVYKAIGHDKLGQKLTMDEYDAVYDYFFELGLENGYMQDFESATEDYIPDFK